MLNSLLCRAVPSGVVGIYIHTPAFLVATYCRSDDMQQLDQHCGPQPLSVPLRRVGGGSRRARSGTTMSTVACLISTFVLLGLFPASTVARTGPGSSSTETTISYMEQTPVPAAAAAAELETQSIERIATPQEADSIFHFHRKDGNSRRGLVGSSPPTCKSRCGTCQPCKPVHVAIGSPHGVISETEYYPEVWRCQCGNRYYMP